MRNFDNFSKMIFVFIAVVFALILLFWAAAAVITYVSIDTIREVGLRGLIEQIWCGPKDCIR